MKKPYRDKNKRIIPNDHFENDPGKPVPLEKFMSEEDIARFNAKTEEMRAKMRRPKKP